MGLDKAVSNIFKASPLGMITKAITGGDKKETPAAAASTANPASDESAANQGKLNPLIMTSAQGATDQYSVGKKLLLGQ